MDGVYRLFYKRDEVKAVEILEKNKNFYHKIMINMAENEINDAKNTFPIISFEFENQCLTIEQEEKIKIISNEYNEHNQTFPDIDVSEGIKLKSDNKELNLECHLNSKEEYCLLKSDFEGRDNYTISVPNRIQQKEFAVKKFESGKKYKLYLKNKISSDNVKNISIDYKEKNSTDLLIKFDVLNNYENSISIINENKEINCDFSYDNKTIKCIIDKTNFNYDENNKSNNKKYTLKLKDICGKEIHSIDIFAKHSGDETRKTGLQGWHIALICIGVAIVLFVIGFFIYRAVRNGEQDSNNDEGETGALIKS